MMRAMGGGERAGDEGVAVGPGDPGPGGAGGEDARREDAADPTEAARPADAGVGPGVGDVDVVTLGPTTEVRVRGEIDIATNPSFDAVLDAARGAGVHLLEMDLSQVTFMGSSGLAALLRAQRLMRERGARLVLLRPSRAVTDLLEMTKLLERFGLGGREHGQPERGRPAHHREPSDQEPTTDEPEAQGQQR
jgi:anti-anti-sigma factor